MVERIAAAPPPEKLPRQTTRALIVEAASVFNNRHTFASWLSKGNLNGIASKPDESQRLRRSFCGVWQTLLRLF
jgi:hypothetical protein